MSNKYYPPKTVLYNFKSLNRNYFLPNHNLVTEYVFNPKNMSFLITDKRKCSFSNDFSSHCYILYFHFYKTDEYFVNTIKLPE